MPSIRPNVLVWARETAGLSIEEAAEKIGFRGDGAIERLNALESGRREPTRAQLLKMAKAYRRSLLTFYLPDPPRKGDSGEDFRSLPQQQTTDEKLVDALVRDIRVRQALVRSVLEDDQDTRPLPFIGSMTLDSGVAAISKSIQEAVGFDVKGFRAQHSIDAAFSYLRTKVEALGVFVLLMGNLGSHHSDVAVSAFRGFALADDIAPFIVINDHDARSAWAFTLLHELAHLWLGATGISGPYGESKLERFCNDVASSLLLAPDELQSLNVGPGATEETAARIISAFAQERLISRSMVAYRLYRLDRISKEIWSNLTETFRQEWLASRQIQREKAKQREGGPNPYVIRRHRLGLGLLRFVDQGVQEGALTPTKAGLVLGVKPRSVATLLSTLHQGVPR